MSCLWGQVISSHSIGLDPPEYLAHIKSIDIIILDVNYNDLVTRLYFYLSKYFAIVI